VATSPHSLPREVLVHGYEEWGADLLQRLDGQFALRDLMIGNREEVLVARDRFGVRPLYYTRNATATSFLLRRSRRFLPLGRLMLRWISAGLDEILRFGAARPPRTAFSGIAALPARDYGIWKNGALWLRHYYEP